MGKEGRKVCNTLGVPRALSYHNAIVTTFIRVPVSGGMDRMISETTLHCSSLSRPDRLEIALSERVSIFSSLFLSCRDMTIQWAGPASRRDYGGAAVRTKVPSSKTTTRGCKSDFGISGATAWRASGRSIFFVQRRDGQS